MKHIIVGFLCALLSFEANAGENCPSGFGRRVCQINATGVIGNKEICFHCPLTLSQDSLNSQCATEYRKECYSPRCAHNFLESCQRACVGKPQKDREACEKKCDDLYKKNCVNCTALRPLLYGDC